MRFYLRGIFLALLVSGSYPPKVSKPFVKQPKVSPPGAFHVAVRGHPRELGLCLTAAGSASAEAVYYSIVYCNIV